MVIIFVLVFVTKITLVALSQYSKCRRYCKCYLWSV